MSPFKINEKKLTEQDDSSFLVKVTGGGSEQPIGGTGRAPPLSGGSQLNPGYLPMH